MTRTILIFRPSACLVNPEVPHAEAPFDGIEILADVESDGPEDDFEDIIGPARIENPGAQFIIL